MFMSTARDGVRGYPTIGSTALTKPAARTITRPGRSNAVRDFVTGVRLFVQGLLVLLRRPRLLLLGALPALLTTLLLVGAMVALAYWVDDLATLLTPFADDWAAGW